MLKDGTRVRNNGSLPNKELWNFMTVYNWITGGYREPDNKIALFFSKRCTLKEIIELFLKIRDDVELILISENFQKLKAQST